MNVYLEKLEHSGIQKKVFELIKSYLYDHQHFVDKHGVYFSLKPFTIELPQGKISLHYLRQRLLSFYYL